AAVRRGLGLTPADFVITQIGVRSWKGNDDVVDAMVAVAAAAPAARLLIVGARSPDSRDERVRRRRLDGRVRVVGYREDVPEILAASDCCVDASYAGLGLTGTLREALAVGTPVVATDLEGNPELVTHGVTGLLVPHAVPTPWRARCSRSSRIRRGPARWRWKVGAGCRPGSRRRSRWSGRKLSTGGCWRKPQRRHPWATRRAVTTPQRRSSSAGAGSPPAPASPSAARASAVARRRATDSGRRR